MDNIDVDRSLYRAAQACRTVCEWPVAAFQRHSCFCRDTVAISVSLQKRLSPYGDHHRNWEFDKSAAGGLLRLDLRAKRNNERIRQTQLVAGEHKQLVKEYTARRGSELCWCGDTDGVDSASPSLRPGEREFVVSWGFQPQMFGKPAKLIVGVAGGNLAAPKSSLQRREVSSGARFRQKTFVGGSKVA
jgi:hypothetical protein